MSQFEVPLDLKVIYLRRRIEEFAALDSELAEGNFNMATIVGHQIKGNAESFDFPMLAPMGMELEEAAKSQDQAKARKVSLEIKIVAEKLLKDL